VGIAATTIAIPFGQDIIDLPLDLAIATLDKSG
jgi:hypothetical protein